MKLKRLVHIIFYKRAVLDGILLLFMVFWMGKSTAQTLDKDSVWLRIAAIDKDSSALTKAVNNYRLLYENPIKISVITLIPKGFVAKDLKPQLSDLLFQFGLEKSYSVSDVKNTALAKSLQEAAYLSYPFSNVLTSNLASVLELSNNASKIVAFENKIKELSIADVNVISTNKMYEMVYQNYEVTIDKRLYLRKRLLDFLVGNYNQYPKNQHWVLKNKKVIPYIDTYQNQYMKLEGTPKLLSTLLPAYKHFENYGTQIKNIKRISVFTLGFDVNILSSVAKEIWTQEVAFIQQKLTQHQLAQIALKLPHTRYQKITQELLETLQYRVDNLESIAKKYQQLIGKNKIVYATKTADKIKIIRKKKSTVIQLFAIEKESKKPDVSFEFLNADTQNIWIYGLEGNDYITASGSVNGGIPIALIGGKGGDKYVLEKGKNMVIYDEKSPVYLVETHQSKVKLAASQKFTQTNFQKYKHIQNNIKPLFGANPDDGIYMGISNTLLVQNFNRNPFSQKHQLSSVLNVGRLGFQIGYYGEIATLSNHFNVFTKWGYQSPNYATNFFGFGNETPNLDANLKLDYNRVRMEKFDVKLGLIKNDKKYTAQVNLFLNSYKIEATENRFITSETLFFPASGFFDRSSYTGLALSYVYKKIKTPFLSNVTVQPKIKIKGNVDLGNFKHNLLQINPTIAVAYPLYGDAITFDTTFDYNTVLGTNVPFYLAANIGGDSGLRGYRNQRFTGQSSLYSSSNIKWKAKDLKSDVLPLQMGVFAGFDMGSVWEKQESSNQIHTTVGGGVWLQSADLIKLQLQVFGFDEGTRISFKLTMGL